MSASAPDTITMPRGIACPRCQSTDWEVRKTREIVHRIIRLRRCQKCELLVRTREVIEEVRGESRPPGGPQEAA